MCYGSLDFRVPGTGQIRCKPFAWGITKISCNKNCFRPVLEVIMGKINT